MDILVDRVVSNHDVTLSRIYLNGRFFCHGLEDEYRPRKIPGETRIPAGCYNLKIRREGGFHARYKTIFPTLHEGMIEIASVPGFEHILIHVGNYDKDTAGCLLVGRADFQSWTVWHSKLTYARFYAAVIKSVANGTATILFLDNDL